ncbi:hypothetical protein CF319_g818 [Tilletia indica]|uniref:Uncharacterized protein n=2 Tax=Tilletia TaxID=13289 RepID=A0A8X7N9T1_9BASI|nr:hypothetical protein CF327_g3328 [Tilletia walkeri]KAE8226615.1 hypothetical protein CF319_g818 [Tilletia indica]KAE8234166.1 hypothetical protein CF326_g786 [Tilletia indica]KAE8260020.1 hypothetical protein A4X13_0g592 [Tilletia indica]KAE8268599.1 hypothetical protein A4X09_0g3748 [Tilletia walkeri]
MPSLAGHYRHADGQYLSLNSEGLLSVNGKDVPKSESKTLRAQKEFWLSEDDGLVGKHGDPRQIRVQLEGKEFRVWVEPRGNHKEYGYQFGLIPCKEDGDYSNLFLGVDASGKFVVKDDWPTEEEKKDQEVIWYIEETPRSSK